MSPRRPRFARLAVRGAVALVVVGLVATAAVAATASKPTTYQTAVATRATVSQALTLSGTIEPVAQATVGFPLSGTVSSVAVNVGQKVTTGQTLATLDTSALQAALSAKQASLATAELTLQKALNGESVGGASGNGGNGGSGGTSTGAGATTATTKTTTTAAPSTGTGSASGTGSLSQAALTAARQAVTRAQSQVQNALAKAAQAVAQATAACSTNPSSTTSTTSTTPGNGSSCATAQAAASAALNSAAKAEQALATAESALSKLLASPGGSTPTTTPSTAPSASAPSTSTTVTYTATQLASYEAAVAAAAADVSAARQNLAQATIVSPITGTVASLNLAPGTSVSSGSSTDHVVIVGNGGYEVTTNVSVANRAKVKVGDKATVLADGTTTELQGKVVAIGVVATSGTTSTYPVTIGFTGTTTGLRNGASATVTVEVAQSVNALTVPTSAVQTTGNAHTVRVLANGKVTTVRVQIGTVGAERTEIKSGLSASQVVVLAVNGQAIPSSGTSSTAGTGAFGGGGNLGGGNTPRRGAVGG